MRGPGCGGRARPCSHPPRARRAFARWEVERVGDVVVLDVRAEGEGLAALRAMFGESGAS
jgi:hypothetical protein